ncbi:hypothetical protein ATANTOWER_000959 [Ataeniobius toweri]|uniref:Uncharacterized protein n=1 Tax=Ataeniobius toweri TaxID=208326 RepID=A0ABU7BLW2_9TELE|nr:hypothetical protein [Ataeniobius toweri]
MSDLILLLLIVFLLLCLALTVGGLLVYSGLFSDVVVKTGAPPISNATVAYKFKQGAYKDCGAAYTESCSICPKLKSIGIFYDDPKQLLAFSVMCSFLNKKMQAGLQMRKADCTGITRQQETRHPFLTA